MLQSWLYGQTMEGFCIMRRSLVLFPVDPRGDFKVVNTFSPHPATHGLPTTEDTGRSLTLWWDSQCTLPELAPSTWHTRLHRLGSGHAHQYILLGEKNPIVYLIPTWQCCLGCQSESSQISLWLPKSNGNNTARRPWMASVAAPKSWPYNNNCSSPKGLGSWNLKNLWGNDIILDLVNTCYIFYE